MIRMGINSFWSKLFKQLVDAWIQMCIRIRNADLHPDPVDQINVCPDPEEKINVGPDPDDKINVGVDLN